MPDLIDKRPPRRPGVLVAEDDPAIRQLVKVALERAGFRVWKAGDGPTALEAYRLYGGEIDVVLSDVRMTRSRGTCDFSQRGNTQHPSMRIRHVPDLATDQQRR